MNEQEKPAEALKDPGVSTSISHETLERESIDELIERLDAEAVAEEAEMLREIEEARRPKWWTFGIQTLVP